MNLKEYSDYFLKAKLKIEQALRLQLKIEEKSYSILMILGNLDDPHKVKLSLLQLRDLYKRKLRILEICNRGLKDATNNFAQFERQITTEEGIATKIKLRLPLFIRNEDFETQLLYELHNAFSGIKHLIIYASNVSAELNAIVNEEYSLTDAMLRRIQLGAFDFSEYRKFLDRLAWLRNSEMDLIKGIKKRNNPDRISSIFIRMEDFQKKFQEVAKKYPVKQILLDALRRHPRLAAIQFVWAPIPDVSVGSGYIAYNFGVIYIPVFVAICYLVEWSPSLIALGIEINKYRGSRK